MTARNKNQNARSIRQVRAFASSATPMRIHWRLFPITVCAAVVMAVAALQPSVAMAQERIAAVGSPFAALKGSWRGAGEIQLESGTMETIRCRAYYTTKAAGRRLGMSIRCASASNRIDLRASLADQKNGLVGGTWEERTFNATGTATGVSSATSMRLKIGGALDGSVSVVINGRSQQVSIYSSNAGLNAVTIRLRRSS
ncbi:MAG: hypothetical protein AAGG72_00300 [Pseudomonadota bacterium]